MKFNLKLLIILILFSCCGQILSSQPIIIRDTTTISQKPKEPIRQFIDLNGKWERSTAGDEWEATELPKFDEKKKKVIYRRTFDIKAEWLNKYTWHLNFLGVEDEVEVYVNDKFIEKYLGAMIPFKVKISNKYLQASRNTIKLVISATSNTVYLTRKMNVYQQKSSTGILRSIELIGTSNAWISSVDYTNKYFPDLNSFQINTKIKISSAEAEKTDIKPQRNDTSSVNLGKNQYSVEAVIVDKQTNATFVQSNQLAFQYQAERTIKQNIDMRINSPTLWSPENPYLYELVVRIKKNGVIIDEYTKSIAFNDLKINKEGNQYSFILNGSPFDIKGIEYYENFNFANYEQMKKQMEQDIVLIKSLGANLIRIRNFAPNPYLIELCNKYGLFIIIDIPARCIPSAILATDEISVRLKNIADRMIFTYNSNVSLIAWGISSGIIEHTQEFKDYSKIIINLVRNNSDKFIYKEVDLSAKKISSEGVDFIAIKENRENPNLSEVKFHILNQINEIKGKPILISYGTLVIPDNNNGYSDPLSIEHQAYYIQGINTIINELNLAGGVLWSFNDYELNSPIMILDYSEQYLCSSGIVDMNRSQRKSFFTLQAHFNNEKEPLLNAGSYKESSPISYIIIGIAVSLIILFLVNRFRRFREYLLRSMFRPYNFYADIRDQRIISTVQSFLLAIVIAFTLGIFFSSLFYFFKSSETAQYFYKIFIPGSLCQEIFYKMVWMPEMMMITVSIISFISILVIAAILRGFSIFVSNRIFFKDTFIITVWAGTPFIILLPLSIILYRVLFIMPDILWISVAVLVLLAFWIIYRILRAVAVVFDVIESRIYLAGTAFIVLVKLIMITIYQINFSVFAYLKFFLHNLLN